ncbi:MAG: GNAT family N-acetyltransferase [Blastochloris sp.]|nr:GNAT family N-acetyltransferase [Blastochloris sp.]
MPLEEGQKHFVAPNWYSILQSIWPDEENDRWFSRGIYDGETMVGYTMYGVEQDGEYWIVRLMIAQDQQKKGYGRAAMGAILDHFRTMPGCQEVFISFEPDNDVARRLYANLGFEDTGRVEWGETVYRLALTAPACDRDGASSA